MNQRNLLQPDDQDEPGIAQVHAPFSGPGSGVRTGRAEELSQKAQEVQQALINIQREQERMEQQARELEELSAKQQEVFAGRKEMSEKLRRAIVVLEREEDDARREVEQIFQTKQAFSETLDAIEKIQPDEWDPNNLTGDLVESLSRIDHARATYAMQMAKVNALRGDPMREVDRAAEANSGALPSELSSSEEAEGEGFGYWLKRGIASNFILILLGAIFLAVYIARGK